MKSNKIENNQRPKSLSKQMSFQLEKNSIFVTETTHSGLTPKYALNYVTNERYSSNTSPVQIKSPRDDASLTPRRRLLKFKLSRSENIGESNEAKIAKVFMKIKEEESLNEIISII